MTENVCATHHKVCQADKHDAGGRVDVSEHTSNIGSGVYLNGVRP